MTETPTTKISTMPKVGIGVILRRGEELLLGERKGSHGAGEHSLPGGKLDPGETPNECASRELGEETGIWLPPGAFRKVPAWTNDLFPADDAHFLTVYLIADAPEGVRPRLCEPEKCEGWHWYPWLWTPTPLFAGLAVLQAEYPSAAEFLAL